MNMETVQIIFRYITVTFYFFAALFTLWEVLRNEKHKPIKAWFKHIWNITNESNWIKLPEITIKWFLKSIEKFRKKLLDLSFLYTAFWKNRILFPIFLIIVGALFLVGTIFNFSQRFLIPYFFITLIILILLLVLYFFFSNIFKKYQKIFSNNILNLIAILFEIYITFPIVIWYYIFIESNIYTSFLSLIVLILILFLSTSIVFSVNPVFLIANTFNIFIIFTSSIVTLISLLIGHSIHPDMWIPKTTQMLISNTIFDILTIYITIYLLKWAIRNQNIYKIPVAVLIDIVFAAVFACFSLHFGLVFSDKSLSIKEIFYVLIAKSPDGNKIELGPYFWVMHTTFIPTLLYCLIIFIAWLAKVMLIPVVWFFGKGQENKNPLRLTATFFAIIASFFALFALFLDSFK